MFYADIYGAESSAEFRSNYPLPKTYLVMVDKAQGRQLIVMEYFDKD